MIKIMDKVLGIGMFLMIKFSSVIGLRACTFSSALNLFKDCIYVIKN